MVSKDALLATRTAKSAAMSFFLSCIYLNSQAEGRNHFVFCPIIETQQGSGEIRMGAPFELDLFASSSFLPSFPPSHSLDDGGRDNGAE